jgi:OmpA-OmpF porin, OOP family
MTTKEIDMHASRRTAILAAAALLALPWAARAQDQVPVLKGAQVTESALIDALAIDAPEAPDGTLRGFGVVRPQWARSSDGSGGNAAPGKASLLMTFAVDSAELTAETTRTLDTVARALQSDQLAGFSFRIEGHADPRGGDAWNLRLSQQRAQAVIGYLVQHHGILAERLTPLGKGSSELLDKRNAFSPLNRRVTIVTQRG